MFQRDKLSDLLEDRVTVGKGLGEPLKAAGAKTQLDDVGQQLIAAANLIHERGLAKFTREEYVDKRLCVHGAISMAAHGDPWVDGPEACAAVRAVYHHLKAIGAKDDINPGGIAPWNNAKERTADEVIAVLEGAALQRALVLQANAVSGSSPILISEGV